MEDAAERQSRALIVALVIRIRVIGTMFLDMQSVQLLSLA